MSTARLSRKPYPTDVSDEEWAFVAPYLTLVREDAPQRKYELREVFNGLRWIVRAGAPWRLLPTNLPPWELVYQQTRRWIGAGCFEAIGHDLRVLLRLEAGRDPGFVLPPRRRVVERSFAWASRFRRLVRDDERLPETVTALHFIAVACLMLQRAALAFSP
jgi:transposase